MTQNNGLPPIPKTAFNESKLQVRGPKLEGARYASSLRIGFIQNQPRFEVMTGKQNNDGKPITLRGKMDTDNFFMVLQALEDLATTTGNEGQRDGVNNKTGRPQEMKVDSQIKIGKSKEGVIWFAVLGSGNDDPKVQIEMMPSFYHEWVDGNGNPYDKAKASALFTRAWVTRTRLVMSNVLDTHFQEPPPRNNNRGGGNRGGGNYGNRNNNYGGNQYQDNNGGGSSSSGMDDFGDDLPL